MSENPIIEYGPARAEDLPAVVDLCMEVEEQHERYWPLRWQRRPGLAEGYLSWLGTRLAEPRMLIQVARERGPSADGPGAVVGMILVTIQKEVPIYTYSEYAFVQDMAVRAGYRRQGIGQRLLADAAAWAAKHGLNQLRLMVADQNPAARAAFEKAGFIPAYQEMVLPIDENAKRKTLNAKRKT